MGELFERVHVVQVELGKRGVLERKECYRFPPLVHGEKGDSKAAEADEEEVSTIVQFCFPEGTIPKASGASWRTRTLREAVQQTFSFVLTAVDGTKQHGYCRRWIGGTKRAECVCVVTRVPSMPLFAQLLDIVVERRAAGSAGSAWVFSFLRSALACALPPPGGSITVRTFSASGGGEPDVYTLKRPSSEALTDYVSVAALLRSFSPALTVELWAALLCERRVVITSTDPERLSAVTGALSALLFPLVWQHVFIPILPVSLAGYVTAPMPFFIGCLDATLNAVKSMGMPLEELYLVSADTGVITARPPGPPVASSRIPKAALAELLSGLSAVAAAPDADADARVAALFNAVMRSLFGQYGSCFSAKRPPGRRETKKHYFDSDAFLKRVPPDAKPLVEEVQASQMWFMFVSSREDQLDAGERISDKCPLLAAQRPQCGCRRTLDAQREGLPPPYMCAKCQGALDDKCLVTRTPGGKLYHTLCFVCSKCGGIAEGSGPRRSSDIVCDVCSGAGAPLGPSKSGHGGKGLKGMVKKLFHQKQDPEERSPPPPPPDPSPQLPRAPANTPTPQRPEKAPPPPPQKSKFQQGAFTSLRTKEKQAPDQRNRTCSESRPNKGGAAQRAPAKKWPTVQQSHSLQK